MNDRFGRWASGWFSNTYVLGSVLYGILGWLSNSFPITGTGTVSIRPGVCVPIFFGYAFGPSVGFVVGLAGNTFGDLLSGYITLPSLDPGADFVTELVSGTNLHWQIGNGVMGLIPGLVARVWPGFSTPSSLLRASFGTVIAVGAGMAIASFGSYLLDPNLDPNVILQETFYPVFISNLVNSLCIVPLLLYNFARINGASREWMSSGLLRKILFSIFLSAIIPIVLLSFFLFTKSSSSVDSSFDVSVKLIFTIAVTLVLAFMNGAAIAVSLSGPLISLTRAAQAMQSESLEIGSALKLRSTPGDDEVSLLSRLFGQMAVEVVAREQNLRQQVAQLRSEVSSSATARGASEMLDNNFFQSLRERKAQGDGATDLPAG